jgi:hypothetical protein
MEQKKIIMIITQLVIIAVFCLLAFGSGATDKNALRAGAQGGICGGNGYTFIGYYDTNSACSSACASKGYSSYCTGDATTACYCK